MLWACIALPELALDVVRRSQPDPEAPLVLVDGPATCRSLVAVNAAAARCGLRVGQKLTVARAIHADFIALPHDAAALPRWQQWLAAWAYRFSHQVCTAWPQALVLEVGSSLGLMGGWPAFEERLRRELSDLQFHHRIALAPFPRAAHLLAWLQDGLQAPDAAQLQTLLARVPVRRAGLPDGAGERLHRLGIRRLQQVFDMPADGLRRRFGESLLHCLDELRGQRQPPLTLFQPPEHFDMRLELEYGVTDHQPLMFPLRRLVMDLATFLARRIRGVQQLTAWLDHERGSRRTSDEAAPGATPLRLRLLAPERDGATLFELLRSRLEAVVLERPVVGLRLVARDLQPLQPPGRDLFDTRTGRAEGWGQLRERLRVRLGEDAVYGVAPVADPRPEHAWKKVVGASMDGGGRDAGRRAPERLPGWPARPGWMLPEPRPLTQPVAEVVGGPERLESGWWDGGDLKRDYYVLRLANGQLAWAFSAVGQHGPWMLHGWFA
ncbi:MAG: DNA polymerase Y family protein [Lautropia mirabilis]|nr:DNA polymerase Y family protein [Lautropia mirabilis]